MRPSIGIPIATA